MLEAFRVASTDEFPVPATPRGPRDEALRDCGAPTVDPREKVQVGGGVENSKFEIRNSKSDRALPVIPDIDLTLNVRH